MTSNKSQMNPATSGGVKNCPSSLLVSKSLVLPSKTGVGCRGIGFSLGAGRFILLCDEADSMPADGQLPSPHEIS